MTMQQVGRRLVAMIVVTLVLFSSTPAPCEPWVGLYFHPQANSDRDHAGFLADFEAMVKKLRTMGFNTIVFDMNYNCFHFTCDPGLAKTAYPANRGFTAAEAKRMAAIARQNGFGVVVALQVLTHSVGQTFAKVYPQHMLSSRKGEVSDTRNPFDAEGETIVFKMVDELIGAFTVNGISPEGFHIGCDELGAWYEDPERETGMSSAEIFAMVINNTYRHIKQKNPKMEVILWSDMLDPLWNGTSQWRHGKKGKATAGAIKLIAKDIVIADWRYSTATGYRYDPRRRTFPSVGEFLDRGFRVWPASWKDLQGTVELIATANREQARTGKVVGHLYTTWLFAMVPELQLLLSDPKHQVAESSLAGSHERGSPAFRDYYRSVADTINATIGLVGRGTVRAGRPPD